MFTGIIDFCRVSIKIIPLRIAYGYFHFIASSRGFSGPSVFAHSQRVFRPLFLFENMPITITLTLFNLCKISFLTRSYFITLHICRSTALWAVKRSYILLLKWCSKFRCHTSRPVHKSWTYLILFLVKILWLFIMFFTKLKLVYAAFFLRWD